VVEDATADYSDKEMHAALEINIPNYASTIVTTKEAIDLEPVRCRSSKLLLVLYEASCKPPPTF
jgi:hypothetical protein